jgi:YD repeat-containing protein
LTDPDGNIYQYTYDDKHRLTGILDPYSGQTDLEYDSTRNLIQVIYANGDTVHIGYDNVYNPVTRHAVDAAGTVLYDYSCTWDGVGNPIAVNFNGLPLANLAFDSENLLMMENYLIAGLPHDFSYLYDAAGNRTRKTYNGLITDYIYNADNRLLQQITPGGPVNYSYDLNGNVINTVSPLMDIDYAYDPENRLTTISDDPVTFTIENYYGGGGGGGRVGRSEGAGIFYEFPSLMGDILTMDPGGVSMIHKVPGISFTELGNTTYSHWDNQLSTNHFYDIGGPIATANMSYFGELLHSTGSIPAAEAGMYATGLKVDWTAPMGMELIGIDYAPDINQRYGGSLFNTGVEKLDLNLDLPAGPFIRVEGTSVTVGVTGQTLSGDFAFEKTTPGKPDVKPVPPPGPPVNPIPLPGYNGHPVRFKAIARGSSEHPDPNKKITSYSWDFDAPKINYQQSPNPDWRIDSFFDVYFEPSSGVLPPDLSLTGGTKLDVPVWYIESFFDVFTEPDKFPPPMNPGNIVLGDPPAIPPGAGFESFFDIYTETTDKPVTPPPPLKLPTAKDPKKAPKKEPEKKQSGSDRTLHGPVEITKPVDKPSPSLTGFVVPFLSGIDILNNPPLPQSPVPLVPDLPAVPYPFFDETGSASLSPQDVLVVLYAINGKSTKKATQKK